MISVPDLIQALSGQDSLVASQVISQQVYLISLLMLVFVHNLITLIIAFWNKSIWKPNFVADFAPAFIIEIIILVLILLGFLPNLTSMI